MNGRILPTQRQLEFLDWEFGVFFHFGIRSFFPGHEDWDDRPMPVSAFNPEALDCRQWIRVAREAGARYAILVCKHHDGFANWPSACSDYSVAQSPWKGGKGDVVREFVDACREYGMKTGLYYSPAQWGGSTPFDVPEAYDDYFVRQITELLSHYGRIDYLWFDGCGSENHEYDRARIIRTIRTLQPDILIFNMWDPDTRWIGNEDGYAPMDNPNVRSDVEISVMTDRHDGLEGVRFLPGECDCRLRDTWFDCALGADRLKTAEELMGMYELSVGRGANFLLNVGPNCRGLLNDSDAEQLRRFGGLLRQRYGRPVDGFGEIARDGENCWSIQAPGFENGTAEPRLIDRVVISEDLTRGEAVRGFCVYAHLPGSRNRRICVYRGATIGHKAICVLPAMRTAKITAEVTQSDGEARLCSMAAYYAG